ncbi:MAG TPA: TRAP transporter small permease subunit, partial [Chromatiales bacterium]|nr:TRAP transporter small permease subunit [Chromatiales bacterium]
MLRFAELLESFNALIGRTVAWLTLVMVLLTVVIVLLRYAFDLGWIWLQESVTWMHASVFMLAAAWTLGRDEHVRVDVFYRKLGPRGRAIVDLAGTWLFLVPVSLFLLWSSFGYVEASWAI